MAVKKYKFGDLIELTNEQNSDGKYGVNDAIGVNIGKTIIPMRGDNSQKDLRKFHIVPPRHFAYNPRGSRKLGLGYNDTNVTYIITFNDNVFRIKKTKETTVLNKYLFMYLSRQEWDRYAESVSWGSSTEVFDWKVFCDIDIVLPDLPTQQKYVDIYESMVANQKSYEKGLDDLKFTCDAYIEELRRKTKCEKIGKYLHEENVRNNDNKLNNVLGVSKDKVFIPTVANLMGIDLDNYKVVNPNWFAYSNRINIGSIALRYKSACLVSPSYTFFSIDEQKINPEYFALWLQREEFLHFAFFYSMGTVKDELDVEELGQMEIPIPSLNVQESIVNIYKVYTERKRINEQLKQQIKDICPILIKGSLEE
ncbi:restriction endonuclease subunit S [Fibrobacter sp. UWR2]|uniref:restriction endonuclease subunit S n=1 Tax=Fibrobacter sp. UWR2 TaxID=1964352 RepID=UPI000B5231AE|nr:restriction endonuclease subunit S [Fibrobacter sp. UWR2]OWV01070.1 type I restriction endonuclease subunit S [Fibrobacter sp. UWR2]